MEYGLLISAVEDHKCLYDKRDPHYKNNIFKDKAWEEISQITSMSKDSCKKKWNLLREKFNKENKKRYLPSGSGNSLEDEWPYIGSMQFLKDFIQPRKTKSNHFETQNEYADDTEDLVLESPLSKRKKSDQYGETIETFNAILADFKERHRIARQNESSNMDVDEQFCKTIILLYRDLPEHVKDEARVQMITYISSLRTQYLLK